MKRVGIIGGGQLGLMLCESLTRLGATVSIFDPSESAPAIRVAHRFFCAAFSDLSALEKFICEQDVVTYEFESINIDCLVQASKRAQVRIAPDPQILKATRSRIAERQFILSQNLPAAPHAFLFTTDENHRPKNLDVLRSELMIAIKNLNYPVVVKTDLGGYDGKGQWVLQSNSDAENFVSDLKSIFQNLASESKIPGNFLVEKRIDLTREYSCIALGTRDKANSLSNYQVFPVFENEHRNQILFQTRLPARIEPELEESAKQMTLRCAKGMNLEGLLTVEFFYGSDGKKPPQLYINEFAPRPHNSGHVTRKATNISQFDALAYCLLEISVPKIEMLSFRSGKDSAVVMQNVLGQDYKSNSGKAEFISQISSRPSVLEFYDYGKTDIKNDRKMGHFIYLT